MNDVIKLMREIVGVNSSFNSYVAEVLGVDEAARTCNVKILSTDLEKEGVRLQAAGTEKGILIIPALSSFVVVTLINEVTGFISLYSEIDKIVLLNEYGEGFPVCSKIVARLNAIEKALNSLLNDYKAHNHTHPQGNTILFVNPPTIANISESKTGDLENENIRQ